MKLEPFMKVGPPSGYILGYVGLYKVHSKSNSYCIKINYSKPLKWILLLTYAKRFRVQT